MNLSILGPSCKWIHAIFTYFMSGFFHLAYCHQVSPHCSMCRTSFLFYGWIIFHLCGYSIFCWSLHLWILILINLTCLWSLGVSDEGLRGRKQRVVSSPRLIPAGPAVCAHIYDLIPRMAWALLPWGIWGFSRLHPQRGSDSQGNQSQTIWPIWGLVILSSLGTFI